MASQLVEAWQMSNEANLFLLESIPAECLKDSYKPRTRTVAAQFAHMHNVRLRWITFAAPKFLGTAKSFARGAQPTRRQLAQALRASERVVARYLEACEESGKVKHWKGTPTTFLAYLIAHEAHHRGLAMVAMRMSGRKLPKELVYGQWQWGKTHNTRKPGTWG